MFLKSLSIKGFKSFADATTLQLEPGVTVIVGPNGSGKSNIVDAVAWVLGSQSPTTMRSSKMDDVIFAGTSKRPALGRAEVALTIDNSSGVLPLDFTEVTVSRTLFRSGDSEYAINGVPCRLLDVQELLSDAGVGRHQHVIVSQGHLDAILQARPEDRRYVIEEAAGVLKYRRRREKAQRRLEATEANLTRLNDLLREVRRQLRPLERQADAARRHGSLVDELRSIRLYLTGNELAGQKTRMASNMDESHRLRQDEAGVRSRLAELDTSVMKAEVELTAQGTSETHDQLVRVESLRQRARGLLALLHERKRSIAREMEAFLDQELIASLEADATNLKEQLRTVEQEALELAPRAEQLSLEDLALQEARSAFEEQWRDLDVTVATDAAQRRGELTTLETNTQQLEKTHQDLTQRVSLLEAELERIGNDVERVLTSEREATQRLVPAQEELTKATASRDDVEQLLERLRTRRGELQNERAHWKARHETLQQALDAARQRAGAAELTDVDGVVGTLLELIAIDSDWESAIEAALGESLSAVVVRDANVARSALSRLRDADIAGSVLALGATASPPVSIAGVDPARLHVRSSRDDVNRLLDALLSNVVITNGNWDAAVDIAASNPQLVVVTRDGERFSRWGWRARGKNVGVTQALVDEAAEKLTEAQKAAEQAVVAEQEANRQMQEAREFEKKCRVAVETIEREVRDVQRHAEKAQSKQRELEGQYKDLTQRVDEISARLQLDAGRIEELRALLPEIEAAEADSHARAQRFRQERETLEQQTKNISTLRTDLEVRAAGIDERRNFLSLRLSEINQRLEKHQEEREEAAARRQLIEARGIATERLAASVEERIITLDTVLAELQSARAKENARVREAADALDGLRRSRAQAERQLQEVQARLQKLQIEQAECEVRIEALVEQVRNEFDVEPEVAINAPAPELGDGVNPAARGRELERELKIMGAINPLALEEFEALSERSTFLETQLEDVKNSRKELHKVIKEVDVEIVQVFSAAYADVSENFTKLFEMLFPGGTGQLRLTDPDNLLETGIEIEAKPSGKNLRKLSLLSGGERSLTALGFLFAVFRSRPSPFYLMDEVEAALDDVNLQRFLHLVEEFRNEAQLLIVSHQKRTMEAGDALYGVSMKPGESSKVVSEQVREKASA